MRLTTASGTESKWLFITGTRVKVGCPPARDNMVIFLLSVLLKTVYTLLFSFFTAITHQTLFCSSLVLFLLRLMWPKETQAFSLQRSPQITHRSLTAPTFPPKLRRSTFRGVEPSLSFSIRCKCCIQARSHHLHSVVQPPPWLCCDGWRRALFHIWSLPLPLCSIRLPSGCDDHHRLCASSPVFVAAVSYGWLGVHLCQLTRMLRKFMYVLTQIMFGRFMCQTRQWRTAVMRLVLFWRACLPHSCSANACIDWAFSDYLLASGCFSMSCCIDCKSLPYASYCSLHPCQYVILIRCTLWNNGKR